ncbi:hypothetical protein CGCA056_v012745 [Colletotrichum aenigma]|uniref:uncharacterized protein n=1 Tax=Colletotrichum aenigma TaxID=1215731 RepID=UPI0018727074|nr:uncharacterized protein CGCA056_v012745 [Colletotrichum aenigma]KAF5507238.1 hypothetical protein CGCA056_v012745 [Colletotrichum aenigma]
MSHELVLRSNTLDSDQGSNPLETKAKENELDCIVRKPGFGMPLGHMPDAENRFPLLYMDDRWGGGWRAATLLIRECCMMKFINALSDKPEWWLKVQDDEIAEKWKKEALSMDWTLYLKHADFTPAMADACISELKKKAVLYEQTGLMPVLDYSIAVIKSDAIMTPDMATSLRKGVKPLEEVPAEDKDWHPNSNEQVLDLVHPSLWPLMYGRSRVLRDRVIGLDDALEHCGMGTILPKRKQKETELLIKAGRKAKIASYINNLHPKEHSDLYAVIERFIEKSLPAWEIIYNWEKDFSVQRLRTDEAGFGDCPCPELCQLDDMDCSCEPWKRPVGGDEEPRDPDDEEQYDDEYKDSERKKRDDAWFFATHALKLPDADPLAEKHVRIDSSHVKTHGFFNNKSQVQVIVKLANIHLTPDKPSTALFYYDSENITECTLDFRTSANGDELDEGALSYEQYDHRSIERTFAVQQYQSIFQDIGSVVTKSGRALFFPNLLQHHVSSFRLADPTKEGHRKILALFLVDPAIEIVSTSNVPPQQKHWWLGTTGLDGGKGVSPAELGELVADEVEWPMGLAEAKEVRLKVMRERTWLKEEEEERLEDVTWKFCEH